MNRSYLKHTLPHIEQRIERTLREQGLTPDTSPGDFIIRHKGQKHRYATTARRSDGKMVIFYARMHNNEDARNKFLSDIAYLRLLQQSTRTAAYVPRVYDASTRRGHEWFTREHIVAEPVGSLYLNTQKLKQSDVSLFVEFFLNMQPLPRAHGIPLEKRGGDFSVPIAEGDLRRVQQLFSFSERKKIKSFFHTAYHTFNNHAISVVHGDCHPGNVLFNGSRLYLIDWETTHLNLRTMDIGYFYVGLANAPAFRKKLLHFYERQTKRKKEFRDLFPLSASFYALNILFSLSTTKRGVSPDVRTKVTQYCTHIVKNAIKGYTTLRRL